MLIVPLPIDVMVAVTTEPSILNSNETLVTGLMENADDVVFAPAKLRSRALGAVVRGGIVIMPLSIARPRYVPGGACVSAVLDLVKRSARIHTVPEPNVASVS